MANNQDGVTNFVKLNLTVKGLTESILSNVT